MAQMHQVGVNFSLHPDEVVKFNLNPDDFVLALLRKFIFGKPLHTGHLNRYHYNFDRSRLSIDMEIL